MPFEFTPKPNVSCEETDIFAESNLPFEITDQNEHPISSKKISGAGWKPSNSTDFVHVDFVKEIKLKSFHLIHGSNVKKFQLTFFDAIGQTIEPLVYIF